MKPTVTIYHAYGEDVEVVKIPHAYCTRGQAYLVPNYLSLASYEALCLENSRLIRRYANLYKGLCYWKGRAIEQAHDPAKKP